MLTWHPQEAEEAMKGLQAQQDEHASTDLG
jgi:hypothetical protein